MSNQKRRVVKHLPGLRFLVGLFYVMFLGVVLLRLRLGGFLLMKSSIKLFGLFILLGKDVDRQANIVLL